MIITKLAGKKKKRRAWQILPAKENKQEGESKRAEPEKSGEIHIERGGGEKKGDGPRNARKRKGKRGKKEKKKERKKEKKEGTQR